MKAAMGGGVKYSVLVPVYNSARWLQTAILSALPAGRDDIELLARDDGSTDSSLAMLHDMAASDHRIKVFANGVNEGCIVTRNRLARDASGDYVAWLDADDYLDSGFFDTADEALAGHPDAGMVRFNFRGVYTDHADDYRQEVADVSTETDALDLWLRWWGRFYIWGMCIRRDLMLACLPPDARQELDDVFYALPLTLAAGRVVHVDTAPMYNYRRGVGSWDGAGSRPMTEKRIMSSMVMRRDQAVWSIMALRRHGVKGYDDKVLGVCDPRSPVSDAENFKMPDTVRRRVLDEYRRWFDDTGRLTKAADGLVQAGLSGDLSWFSREL